MFKAKPHKQTTWTYRSFINHCIVGLTHKIQNKYDPYWASSIYIDIVTLTQYTSFKSKKLRVKDLLD